MEFRIPRATRAALQIFLFLFVPAVPVAAMAETPTGVTLTLQNHRFTPSALTVPAGQKLHVTLINDDPAMEEFDSDDLVVEEDVTPKGRTGFDIGPLAPGEYHFMGEFHAKTAQGKIIAVPMAH
ncbi:MAG: cupredoxin domain-containing protein [Pseudomonadota bacterium]|nr:cupredoxin domain-containing protein [Pseudomonadota bacterium]